MFQETKAKYGKKCQNMVEIMIERCSILDKIFFQKLPKRKYINVLGAKKKRSRVAFLVISKFAHHKSECRVRKKTFSPAKGKLFCA
jgi:hypothetical protein